MCEQPKSVCVVCVTLCVSIGLIQLELICLEGCLAVVAQILDSELLHLTIYLASKFAFLILYGKTELTDTQKKGLLL